jgi:hypothetical protein
LATYISVNEHLLHRYANEDVSLGAWIIGWMLTTSMTTASVVAHLLIASGRLNLEMCLWPHLIGHAVAFSSL